MTTLFITGIDTDIGKTVACGVMAKTMLHRGYSVYTQKIVETGCENGVSNDLLEHEKIVGKPFNHEEIALHCPYCFTTAVSPHLSAQRDGKKIDENYLAQQMRRLSSKTDHLLVEGAGGLCVPLNEKVMIVDFIQEQGLPIVLVTSPRLGSINHTLLTLSLCESKDIDVRAIIYNHYPNVRNWMREDTCTVLKAELKRRFSKALWLDLNNSSEVFHFTQDEMNTLLG